MEGYDDGDYYPDDPYERALIEGVEDSIEDRSFDTDLDPDWASTGSECPRCGASTDRLVGVTGRAGTRNVCERCRSDALASDRSFWHWYWKE